MKDLLKKIRENQIAIEISGENLKLFINNMEVDEQLIEEIKSKKSELIDFLKRQNISSNHLKEISIDFAMPAEDGGFDLSSPQLRMWILSQLPESNMAYKIAGGTYIFRGELDVILLKKSLLFLIERHESLRTIFGIDCNGIVKQYIKEITDLSLILKELDFRGDIDVWINIENLVQKELERQFDLERGPLFRATLICVEDNCWVFSYEMHHIVSDGLSMNVIMQELQSLYNSYKEGIGHSLLPLRVQYKDYAHWQQRQLRTGELAIHGKYWFGEFNSGFPKLELITDKIRPGVKRYLGGLIVGELEEVLTQDLLRMGRSEGCTLFMSLLGAVIVLLYRYSGQVDIVIGTPVAGREDLELENQVGFYVNMLALRIRFLEDDTYRNLLLKIKEISLKAFEHQMYPFDELVKDLKLERDLSRHPVFDVVMVVQNAQKVVANTRTLNSLNTTEYNWRPNLVSKFDLSFNFAELPSGILVYSIEYDSDLFNDTTIARMKGHLEVLIRELLSTPDIPLRDIKYLSGHEQMQLLNQFERNKSILDRRR